MIFWVAQLRDSLSYERGNLLENGAGKNVIFFSPISIHTYYIVYFIELKLCLSDDREDSVYFRSESASMASESQGGGER